MLKLVIVFGVLAIAAFAQTPPSPFSGTVVSYNDASVTLKNKQGEVVVLQMTPGWTVSVNRRGASGEIQPGSFVATTNDVVDAGTGKSTELRVLEPGYRPEEGTHPVSPNSPNQMTHGTVKGVQRTAGGIEIDVTYPNGGRHLLVPAEAPITVSDLQSRDKLQPGVAVSGVTRKGADGVVRASRLTLPN